MNIYFCLEAIEFQCNFVLRPSKVHYSRCQHLNQQDLATRRSALRQALDEDLRRFIREGIISVTDQDDTPAVISEPCR